MTAPTTLGALARTLRSKNAGVDLVTFDLFFEDAAALGRVISSGVLTEERVANLYSCKPDDIVNFVVMPNIHAVKITMRRAVSSGRPGDSDVFGAQQYALLSELIVP